jgi:plasmid stability protein
MPAVTVRNISEETHRALKVRAVSHGRSTEAEIRAILEEAVAPESRLKVGSALAEIGRQFGFPDLNTDRDQTPAGAATFE